MTVLSKAELQHVAEQWQWIFGNEIFVVLSRSHRVRKDVRRTGDLIHCKPLMRFLCSASLRKRRSKIIYAHLPKTGGTSMWASLTRAFPSHVYYPSLHAYLNNPPARDDYDLVGLHCAPSVALPSVCEDDWIIGMIRHPAQRLFSAVMHFRRPNEDPETFTASAKAMRDMRLADYLLTDLGRSEACLQLRTLGTSSEYSLDTASDEELLRAALDFTRRDHVILAPSECSGAFRDFVAHRLCCQPGALWRLNANDPAIRTAYLPEFRGTVALIESINARERDLYGFVCSRFDEQRRLGYPRWRYSRQRPWAIRGLRTASS